MRELKCAHFEVSAHQVWLPRISSTQYGILRPDIGTSMTSLIFSRLCFMTGLNFSMDFPVSIELETNISVKNQNNLGVLPPQPAVAFILFSIMPSMKSKERPLRFTPTVSCKHNLEIKTCTTRNIPQIQSDLLLKTKF